MVQGITSDGKAVNGFEAFAEGVQRIRNSIGGEIDQVAAKHGSRRLKTVKPQRLRKSLDNLLECHWNNGVYFNGNGRTFDGRFLREFIPLVDWGADAANENKMGAGVARIGIKAQEFKDMVEWFSSVAKTMHLKDVEQVMQGVLQQLRNM